MTGTIPSNLIGEIVHFVFARTLSGDGCGQRVGEGSDWAGRIRLLGGTELRQLPATRGGVTRFRGLSINVGKTTLEIATAKHLLGGKGRPSPPVTKIVFSVLNPLFSWV